MIELQRIDANCNNCKFMVRNMETFSKWESWNKELQLKEFNAKKEKAIEEAWDVIDNATDIHLEKSGRGMLRVAEKMYFQFNRDGLLGYGNCSKFNKPVSFIPETCQIHTQDCFIHRKD